MERWVAKLIAGVALFVLPLICTLIPLRMSSYVERRGREGKLILSRLMCFGGGVFFSTFLLHMIPEVREILRHSLLAPKGITYPVAELIMGAGFFLVLVIETMAMKGQNRGASHSQPVNEMVIMPPPDGDVSVRYVIEGQLLPADATSSRKTEGQSNGKETLAEDEAEEPLMRGSNHSGNYSGNHNGNHHGNHHGNHPAAGHHDMAPQTPNSRALVLAIALSLHRIFEGMSVGLKQTLLGVWSLFIAVICHEVIIAFSLGLQFMLNRNTMKRNLFFATVCSLFMPIGLTIGAVLVEFGENVPGLDIANGVLQAISTGTFIYVTFFEILHEEFSHDNYDVSNILSLAIGFLLMAAINAIPENDDVIQNVFNATLAPSAELEVL